MVDKEKARRRPRAKEKKRKAVTGLENADGIRTIRMKAPGQKTRWITEAKALKAQAKEEEEKEKAKAKATEKARKVVVRELNLLQRDLPSAGIGIRIMRTWSQL